MIEQLRYQCGRHLQFVRLGSLVQAAATALPQMASHGHGHGHSYGYVIVTPQACPRDKVTTSWPRYGQGHAQLLSDVDPVGLLWLPHRSVRPCFSIF